MSLKVQTVESGSAGITAATARAGRERPTPIESLDLANWERVYLDPLEYKKRKGLTNLVSPAGRAEERRESDPRAPYPGKTSPKVRRGA